ncbi:hypothetical protein [Shewanella halifaxensis]|uniref:hypothetical protein n=1 Tax=Shewanella halifaxensis TaxID=271098 RepID=UPI000D591CB8|nr:hypothetical protein [Shewanella halifaxensis]
MEKNQELETLTFDEIKEVNGGFWQWFGGYVAGEVLNDIRANPSSYGSRYSHMNNMHFKA